MFTRRYKKCYCMNNSSYNTCNSSENMIEDKCNNICSKFQFNYYYKQIYINIDVEFIISNIKAIKIANMPSLFITLS